MRCSRLDDTMMMFGCWWGEGGGGATEIPDALYEMPNHFTTTAPTRKPAELIYAARLWAY